MMMDFLSIKSEYECYKAHIESTENTMKSISSFFVNSQKNLIEFAENTKNNINELFHNLLNCDNRSTHIKKFFNSGSSSEYLYFMRHKLSAYTGRG